MLQYFVRVDLQSELCSTSNEKHPKKVDSDFQQVILIPCLGHTFLIEQTKYSPELFWITANRWIIGIVIWYQTPKGQSPRIFTPNKLQSRTLESTPRHMTTNKKNSNQSSVPFPCKIHFNISPKPVLALFKSFKPYSLLCENECLAILFLHALRCFSAPLRNPFRLSGSGVQISDTKYAISGCSACSLNGNAPLFQIQISGRKSFLYDFSSSIFG